MYFINFSSLIIVSNHFCDLHGPIYLKNVDCTSLEEVCDLYRGLSVKNINFPDFSIKKIHIFLKNNTGESYFASP